MSQKARQSGFTLLEVVIALAVGAMVIMGSLAWISNSARNAQTIRRKADEQVGYSGFTAQVIPIMESADVAVQFQHLPVAVDPNCNAPYPCVLKLVNGQFQQLTVSDPLITSGAIANHPGQTPAMAIEFFRDQDPVFSPVPLFSNGVSKGDVTSVGVPFPTPTSGTATGLVLDDPAISLGNCGVTNPTVGSTGCSSYYTTWPLLASPSPNPNPNNPMSGSPPFLVLRSPSTTFAMVYDENCSAFKLTSGTAPATPTLVLISNLMDPTQYVIQQLTAASAVTGGACSGKSYYNLTFTEPAILNDPTFVAPTSKFFGGNIPPSMDWINAMNTFKASGSVPNLATVSISNDYPFAAYYPSIFDPNSLGDYQTNGNAGPGPTQNHLDLFYPANQSNGVQAQGAVFAVTPVLATAYWLQWDPRNPNCPADPGTVPSPNPTNVCTYQLWTKTWSSTGVIPRMLVDHITGPLYFARQLGTRSITIFVMNIPQAM